jgi:hypothetical protein
MLSSAAGSNIIKQKIPRFGKEVSMSDNPEE